MIGEMKQTSGLKQKLMFVIKTISLNFQECFTDKQIVEESISFLSFILGITVSQRLIWWRWIRLSIVTSTTWRRNAINF